MLGTLDVEEAAKEAAGNWRQFKCFVWFRDREINDADQWAIIYTHNRDSGLLSEAIRHSSQKRWNLSPRTMMLMSFSRQTSADF